MDTLTIFFLAAYLSFIFYTLVQTPELALGSWNCNYSKVLILKICYLRAYKCITGIYNTFWIAAGRIHLWETNERIIYLNFIRSCALPLRIHVSKIKYYTLSSRFISSSLTHSSERANWREIPVRIPNFCLCGTDGIQTHISIRNPTRNPRRNPHKKSLSVPMDDQKWNKRGVPSWGQSIVGPVFWFKFSLNSDAGLCSAIQASSWRKRLQSASVSSSSIEAFDCKYWSTWREK